MKNEEQISGVKLLKEKISDISESPGIYKMSDAGGKALYVGKAKNLRRRLSSYIQLDKLSPRIRMMVVKITNLEVITTQSEIEALLLEANLIKDLKPRYNILLKDDKSFPYIAITKTHEFPRITKHRGERKPGDIYFGPFATAGDVNLAITTLQKAFLLRSCSDNIFASRSRPCLEYHIKRCSAPCVGKISRENYNISVNQAKNSIEGRNHEIQQELTATMLKASNRQDYEKAASYRDRIKALASIQARQSINTRNIRNADVIALSIESKNTCIAVSFIRNHQTLGSKVFFPSQTEGAEPEEIIEAFITSFYKDNPSPEELIINHNIGGAELLGQALSLTNEHKVTIIYPRKGEKAHLAEASLIRAKEALVRKISEDKSVSAILSELAPIMGVEDEINRIEVYDNSHIFGDHAVGAMIVAGRNGFIKSEYRKFNVDRGEKDSGGDDYWMLRQVLSRRFRKLQESGDQSKKPELVLIDGGAAHLKIAGEVFADIGINDIVFACIAKGVDRNAGKEEFHLIGKPPFRLERTSSVLYYLQRLRDEAHRFAISAHRRKRDGAIAKSELDLIPGIGATRKKALLGHFGSLKAIKAARLEDLLKVKNINQKTAEEIYNYFR